MNRKTAGMVGTIARDSGNTDLRVRLIADAVPVSPDTPNIF
jgi:hypothetical protein